MAFVLLALVGKRRVFARQFPLLANGTTAGWNSSAFLEDSDAWLTDVDVKETKARLMITAACLDA